MSLGCRSVTSSKRFPSGHGRCCCCCCCCCRNACTVHGSSGDTLVSPLAGLNSPSLSTNLRGSTSYVIKGRASAVLSSEGASRTRLKSQELTADRTIAPFAHELWLCASDNDRKQARFREPGIPDQPHPFPPPSHSAPGGAWHVTASTHAPHAPPALTLCMRRALRPAAGSRP